MTHRFVNLRRSLLLMVALAAGAASAQAVPPPENVVQLSAGAAIEVPQDTLVIQLQATREGADPARLQAELKALLDAALAQARRDARPGALDVRTGNFSVLPRYSRDRRIAAWQGTAELVLEGTEIARVSEAAGRVPGMVVSQAAFRLSREGRERAAREVQAQAIAQFRAKAADIARGFGFNGYGLREVAVNTQEAGPPRMRMLASDAAGAPAEAALPVEAGKTTVTVNVSGSVQLR